MKKLNILFLGLFLAFVTGCTYTFPEPEQPTSGSADFTKVVVVGNSLSAGFMDGALYDAGQEASYANIVAMQMQLVGAGEFNQPDIESPIGNYGTAPDGITPLGHLVLKNPLNPAPSPIVPGDPFNTNYSGDKAALNNFAVPGMRIVHAEFPGYGSGAGNPYFARFASSPTTTVLADAIAANGTFFMFWLGGNDALGYATAGAIGNPNGDGSNSIDMTDATIFDAAYRSAVSKLITDGGKQGILANVPNVSDIPFFTTVPWNAVGFDSSDPVDAGTIAALNAAYGQYNAGLGQAVQAQLITKEDSTFRAIQFGNGANGVVITDNTLTDLTGLGLASMRQANANDLLTLSAGAVIPGGEGVSSPLGEQYTLIPADIDRIGTRIAAFNTTIKAVVDASEGNLTLIDINSTFADFAANGTKINGSGMDATIFPPFGAFSLDGVHPNQRGSAYVASLFIDQINTAFEANIPNVNPNNYSGNALPIP